MKRAMIAAVAVGFVAAMGVAARAAETVTVKGEVVDSYCYALMGAKGESHRKCGLACAAKGIPLALLENGTGSLFVLLPDRDKSPLPKEVTDRMGRQATVTGKLATVGGSRFLTVESVK
jgi:type 1 fimbria pilin